MDISVKYRHVRIGCFSDSDLKSAIQKYLRREEKEKGEMAMRFFLSVSKKKDEAPQRVKSILSNIMNRLIVMMSEEISICETSLPIHIQKVYKKYIVDQDIRHIYSLYKTLFSCRKCRILSDIKATFLLPFFEDGDLSNQEISRHNEMIRPLLPHLTIETSHTISIKEWKTTLLKRQFELTFFQLGYLVRPYKTRKETMKQIWNILMDIRYSLTIRQTIESLYFLYKKMTHREKTLYLYHAILLGLTQVDSSLYNVQHELIDPKLNALPDTFKCDEYVLDMHTGNKKSGQYEFVMSGAWIFHQDERFFHQFYRLIYIRKKQRVDNCFYHLMIQNMKSKTPIAYFQSIWKDVDAFEIPDVMNEYTIYPLSQTQIEKIYTLPHAQKKCSSHKKVVYVDREYVYKGPYKKTDSSFRNALFFQHAFQIFGDDTILPVKIMHDQVNNVFFLCMPNIGSSVDSSDIETVTTKIEENVKIIKRGTYIHRASEVIAHLDTLQKKQCLRHLYTRFLLNVGDSGLYNILISKDGRVYGIDLEEQRNKCKFESIIHVLAPRTSQKDVSLLEEALPWVELQKEWKFESMNWPTAYKNNIKYRAKFIECLLKYHASIEKK